MFQINEKIEVSDDNINWCIAIYCGKIEGNFIVKEEDNDHYSYVYARKIEENKLFKQMTVEKIIKMLENFDKDEEIYTMRRESLGSNITAINIVKYDDFGNLVITLDDNLIKK